MSSPVERIITTFTEAGEPNHASLTDWGGQPVPVTGALGIDDDQLTAILTP